VWKIAATWWPMPTSTSNSPGPRPDPGAQIPALRQERYPQYVEELIGIAKELTCLRDVSVVNAMEAVTWTPASHRCTAWRERRTHCRRHVLMAHNEDWVPEDEDDVFIIHASPRTNRLPAMTYGVFYPNRFNAYGIAQMCDSVYPNDSRIGTARGGLAGRAGSRTRMSHPPHASAQRAAGYNTCWCMRAARCTREVSAAVGILYGENGYIVTPTIIFPRTCSSGARTRDLVASVCVTSRRRLLQREDTHTSRPAAIQRDMSTSPTRSATIRSMPITTDGENGQRHGHRPDRREMHIAWGNPCENPTTPIT